MYKNIYYSNIMNIKYWFNILLEYINELILRVYEPIKLKLPNDQ